MRARRPRVGRGVVRQGPLPAADIDPTYEHRANLRKQKLRRIFDWLDGNGPEVRRLVGYYGSQKVGDALMRGNPVDVPRLLGDEDEYRRHCDRYRSDGAELGAGAVSSPAPGSFAAKFLALRGPAKS